MSLEIQHIAPYLPYSLEVQFGNRSIIDRGVLTGVYKANDSVVRRFTTDKHFDEPLWLCAPLLRPLSSFDENALNELKDTLLGKWCDAYDHYFESWFSRGDLDTLILKCSYEVFQYLLEKHYDVFNLIDKNLAIEIK